jgi:hypothetical protein
MSLNDDMGLISALIEKGELDSAEELLDKVEHIAKAQQAADEADDDEDDNDGTDDDADEEEEDDSDEDDVSKSFRENNITYPRDDLTDAMNEHRRVEHPQTATHATWHRFMERARTIAARDACPMHVAMQRARGEMGADHVAELRQPISAVKKLGLPKTPPLYPESDLQDELASSGRDKKKTHRRRIRRHDQQVKKMTHEDAVATEIAKGCSRELAEQRVMYQYGNTLPRSSIIKGADTVTTRFMKRCDDIMIRDDCSRTEAMQKARQENEAEFEIFQLV